MGMGKIYKVPFKRGRKAKVAPAVKTYVSKAIDRSVEDKMNALSLTSAFSSVGTAWVEQQLTSIAQGDTQVARTGRRIKIRSVELNGVIAGAGFETAADDAYNVVRLVLGLYTGQSTTPLATAVADRNLPITKSAQTRGCLIKKYVDKFIPLEITSSEKGNGDGYAPQLKRVKFYKHWKKGMTINWGDDSTDYPDKRIVLSMASDSGAVVHPGFVAGFWKIMFEDA